MSIPIETDIFWDSIILEVQGRLAKVPRVVFASSPVFQDMFSLPPQPGVVPDGSDEDHPLRLEGVKISVFKTFTRVVMMLDVFESSMPNISWLKAVEVYDLAVKWQMDLLATRLKTSIPTLFDDDNAVWQLYASHHMANTEWVRPALCRIIGRPASLSAKDIDILGSNIASQIFHTREMIRSLLQISYGSPIGQHLFQQLRISRAIDELEESLELSSLQSPLVI